MTECQLTFCTNINPNCETTDDQRACIPKPNSTSATGWDARSIPCEQCAEIANGHDSILNRCAAYCILPPSPEEQNAESIEGGETYENKNKKIIGIAAILIIAILLIVLIFSF